MCIAVSFGKVNDVVCVFNFLYQLNEELLDILYLLSFLCTISKGTD